MLQGFIDDYLLLNLDYYIDGINFPINLFLLAIAVGMCIACVLITVKKRAMSAVITQLARHEAYTAEAAKTLAELKIKPGLVIKSSLSHRSQLTHIVALVGVYPFDVPRVKGQREGKIDFETAKFYISEGGLDRAAKIKDEAAPSYVNTVLGCVLILMIFTTVVLFMPDILTLITGVRR